MRPDAPVTYLSAAAYNIPIGAPEADGTLALAWRHACRGARPMRADGYTYSNATNAALIGAAIRAGVGLRRVLRGAALS
jgi:hypothetical protein